MDDSSFKVVDDKGIISSLGDFIDSLFSWASGSSPAPDQQQIGHLGGQSEASEAMEEIYERAQEGKALFASDISRLPVETLMNIREHGDDYVRGMIREFEIENEQKLAQEWAEYDHSRMGRER